MKKLFIQTQLSNYTKDGLFILECDSGWQMVMGRVRELLKLVPDLQIDILGPKRNQLVTVPEALNPEFKSPLVRYVEVYVPPNAILSRHHFDTRELNLRKEYDVAYINDPMHFRNFKAMFHNRCKLFAVHNHFIDNPTCPKFPKDLTLWYGQCEAVQRADVNFWQCDSALKAFEADFGAKAPNSLAWDDGYSIAEIQTPVNLRNVRFDPSILRQKPIIFVPNRVGGKGVSSDYTNCGKFLFEMLPKLRKLADFNVVAGNPSQKFSNQQLVEECGVLPLTIDALTRDEYKLIAANTAIVVALYDKDTYGGTAVRECIELGALPLWLNCNEYASIAKEAEFPYGLHSFAELLQMASSERDAYSSRLRNVVRNRCSFEATTPKAAERMGLL